MHTTSPQAPTSSSVRVNALLGHASWHAYRELVDSLMLPEREPR